MTRLRFYDTTSRALAHEFAALCKRLRECTPGAERACWSVRGHNALGLAVANALAALPTGVDQIECTVSGLGEGAGNTPFEQVVRALDSRSDAFEGTHVAIDRVAIDALKPLLARITVSCEDTDSDVIAVLQRWQR